MSVREKDFIKYMKKIESMKDVALRNNILGENCLEFLRKFPDKPGVIGVIEKTVLNKLDEDGEIPSGFEGVYVEVAKYYSRKGEFDRAEDLLSKVEKSRNVTVCLQARYESELIKVKRSLEQGTIDKESIENIKGIVKDDEKHDLNTSTVGEFNDYDLFCNYFIEKKIPVEHLIEEIFPSTMKKPTGTSIPIDPDNPPIPSNNNGYDEGLSANNRLKFLVENFPIKLVRIGKGKFYGDIIFEIEGSDLVIVENFWRQTCDGEIVESYGKATYILPKDQALDIIKLPRGELVGKDKSGIVRVSHGSKKYYENLIERYNSAQNAQSDRIEQKSNPLENAETRRRVKPKIKTEEIQDIENLQVDEENTQTDVIPTTEVEEVGKTTEKKKDSTPKDFSAENYEFLSSINSSIGDIIPPEIMKGLLKRASYSFKDLYNGKLKDEIIDRLEILEVLEENREIEAQKVFLYLRMAKNISMINSGAIKGKELDNVLDDATIEYEKGFSFFEKHIGDGLKYNDLKKYMKKYVETGIDPLEQQTASQSKETDTEKETEMEVLDVATRCLELLERLAEIDDESERLDIQLAEKEQSHFEKQQATIQAREEEERARKAIIEATEQEEKSSQELDEMRAEREKLAQEKRRLEEKKEKIESILGGDAR